MYKIIFKKSAAKEFLLIPAQYHQAIDESLSVLSSWRFDILDIKMLQPKEEKRYRLRVWNYRVIFRLEKEELMIYVIKIGSRWDVYK